MPNITIDELDFNTEDLSDDGKLRIAQIEWIDSQISQKFQEISVIKTAIARLEQEIKEHILKE
tara:strand:- start:190 stop:378 length:189 start_codon:yes stop_codon:yes gene_type:complete